MLKNTNTRFCVPASVCCFISAKILYLVTAPQAYFSLFERKVCKRSKRRGTLDRAVPLSNPPTKQIRRTVIFTFCISRRCNCDTITGMCSTPNSKTMTAESLKLSCLQLKQDIWWKHRLYCLGGCFKRGAALFEAPLLCHSFGHFS